MKAENVKAIITGMRWFNEEVEGQRYDFTKIFVEEDLTENENSRGKASQEYEIGPASEHLKYDGFTLPMEVDGDIHVTTNGKGRTKTSFKIKRVINQQPKKAA